MNVRWRQSLRLDSFDVCNESVYRFQHLCVCVCVFLSFSNIRLRQKVHLLLLRWRHQGGRWPGVSLLRERNKSCVFFAWGTLSGNISESKTPLPADTEAPEFCWVTAVLHCSRKTQQPSVVPLLSLLFLLPAIALILFLFFVFFVLLLVLVLFLPLVLLVLNFQWTFFTHYYSFQGCFHILHVSITTNMTNIVLYLFYTFFLLSFYHVVLTRSLKMHWN